MIHTNDKNTLNFTSISNMDHIVEIVDFKKKEHLTQTDILALFYAAMDFFGKNDLIIDKIGFDDTNSICDSELYLNNFDGVYFDDNLKFTTLFFSEENTFILRVYNEETDDFSFYMAN